MYDHLHGSLERKRPTSAVIVVGGVGYDLTIPLSSFEALPELGESATLHTHLYVREDALKLFGFATRDERRFFRRLLAVTGIGPSVALSILSSTKYADFRDAIVGEQLGALTRLKGVGKKLAQRMVLELRDSLAKEVTEVRRPEQPEIGGLREDAIAALTTLGFKQLAALKEVDRILGQTEPAPDLGEIVRLALRSAR